MSLSLWLREPAKRSRLAAWLLLGVAVAWGVSRFGRSLIINFLISHDLYTYYSLWYVLLHREFADIGLSRALYLPHTWLFFTPIFMFGWIPAQVLMLLINLGAIVYIWRRLSELAGLTGVRQWLLLALFWGWLSTGLVVGLGNLALVCVAAMLAAYPFNSRARALFLALSAMKQTLVFPVYFLLLLKRPKTLLLPFAIFAVCGITALVWARMGPLELLKLARDSVSSVSGWTQYDHTCLRRLLAPFISGKLTLTAVNWLAWFGLFGVVVRFIKEPLAQLAALMLLCLLPIYHNIYDMVAAAPALAIFLARGPLVWPALMSLFLAANLMTPVSRVLQGSPLAGVAAALEYGYYPLLILLFLGGLIYLENRRPVVAPARLAGVPAG